MRAASLSSNDSDTLTPADADKLARFKKVIERGERLIRLLDGRTIRRAIRENTAIGPYVVFDGRNVPVRRLTPPLTSATGLPIDYEEDRSMTGHPYIRDLVSLLNELRVNVDADLESERSVPEDADITRAQSTRYAYAHLAGAVEVVEVLPESMQAVVAERLRVEKVADLLPDLTKFDPWEGHRTPRGDPA